MTDLLHAILPPPSTLHLSVYTLHPVTLSLTTQAPGPIPPIFPTSISNVLGLFFALWSKYRLNPSCGSSWPGPLPNGQVIEMAYYLSLHLQLEFSGWVYHGAVFLRHVHVFYTAPAPTLVDCCCTLLAQIPPMTIKATRPSYFALWTL